MEVVENAPDSREETRAKEVQAAGRGVLVIAFAKVYFMIAGAGIEVALARILGPILLGVYRSAMNIVSPINNVIVTGTIQAISKFTSEDADNPARAAAVQRAGLRAHLVLGLVVAGAYFGLAGVIADQSGDPAMTNLLRITAGVVVCYAFYAVFVGTANGRRQFSKQAGLDILFATLRATLVVGAAAAGFGVRGSLLGFVVAAATILTVASVVVGMWRQGGEVFPSRRVLAFLSQVALYAAILNVIMFVDQWFLKPGVKHHAMALGLPEASAIDVANHHVGLYSAVQNLARLPYQAILAVTFVIFPLVSRSTFDKDTEATQGYIRQTLRYSLIVAAAMGVVLAANATALLGIPYGAKFQGGGPAMAVLSLGSVAFAVLTIAGTILNGAGRTITAVVIVAITLALAAGANYLLIPRVDLGSDVLLGCALATSGAMVVGCLLSGLAIWRAFGAFLPALTLARVAIAIGACMGLARVIPDRSKIMTLGETALMGLVYLGVLIGTGELGKADVAKFSKVLRRKK